MLPVDDMTGVVAKKQSEDGLQSAIMLPDLDVELAGLISASGCQNSTLCCGGAGKPGGGSKYVGIVVSQASTIVVSRIAASGNAALRTSDAAQSAVSL